MWHRYLLIGILYNSYNKEKSTTFINTDTFQKYE